MILSKTKYEMASHAPSIHPKITWSIDWTPSTKPEKPIRKEQKIAVPIKVIFFHMGINYVCPNVDPFAVIYIMLLLIELLRSRPFTDSEMSLSADCSSV